MELAPNHIIVEVAKALEGSFKLVTLVPKTVKETTQLLRETQKNGDTQTNHKAQMDTKHKPRLSIKNTLSPKPNRAV